MKVVARGPRRAFALAAVLSLTALLLVASGSAARRRRTQEGLVGPVWTPVGLRGGDTTVVLQLSGDPVALVQAEKGRKLSKSEKTRSQKPAEGGAGRPQRRDRQARRLRPRPVPVRLQRDQGAGRRGASWPTSPRCRGSGARPCAAADGARHRARRAVDRRARGLGGLAGLHGEGVKVAIIDTGIDYTHANFGGPGTVAAYKAAHAADTQPPTRRCSARTRPVKGGIDFVGDTYNADARWRTTSRSRSPTRTRSTATATARTSPAPPRGSGVTRTARPTPGPYDATRTAPTRWTIGPGVAPKADLYAMRVFGCHGSTDVTSTRSTGPSTTTWT